MAKEPTSTRLPMPGLSRIPLPGLIRPPTAISLPRTSLLRPPATFAKTRPISYSGLRPPIQQALTIKKSSSGDRINTLNSTVNMVSKKTTTVFKKFFAKADPTPTKKDETVTTKLQNVTTILDTPRPTLTRSETFVRTDSPEDLMATPMPVTGEPKRGALCESTPLLNTNTKQCLYITQSLDSTYIPNCEVNQAPMQRKHTLESTRLSNIGFGNTMDIDSPRNKTQVANAGFGNTIDIDTQKNIAKKLGTTKSGEDINDCTQTFDILTENKTFNKTHSIKELDRPDATHNINATDVLGRTLCVISSHDGNANENITKTLDSTQLLDKLSNVNVTQTIDGGASTKLIEYTDILSPATNATYSNPGSSENLLMIDDVSIPSGFEEDVAMDVQKHLEKLSHQQFLDITTENLDDTLKALAPDKANMKLPLNSTMNTERLLDITEHMTTPAKHMQLLNLTKDYMDTPNIKNTTQLLYMTQTSTSCTTTPDRNACKKYNNPMYQLTPIPVHLQSPMLLKGAKSDLVLPIRTPDEDGQQEAMDIDMTLISSGGRTDAFYQQTDISQTTSSLQDVNNPNKKSRFSFGLDLTESTLDCSIELVDVSLSSQAINCSQNSTQNMTHSTSTQQMQQQFLKKQNSFDLDESLGILTPDQMKEFLDSAATNNTNNLDLPLLLNNSNNVNNLSHKFVLQQMRIDQTPSPEELPLDPVEVKTDINDMVLQHQQLQLHQQQNLQGQITFSNEDHQQQCLESLSLHTDTEPSKTETINKSISSSVSKISTSFITSVTSVTSLDTGYQGDGEMSRPASRGPCDHSPSNGPIRKGVSRQPSFHQQQGVGGHLPPVRRQDPMTDSDFFTESDADDVFHRGDRRAQVIDGQLYGPMLQPAASVFISEDPQMEDSCMESSGIFTDVENRCDEDLAQMRRQDTHETTNDLSPDNDLDGDDSTETVRSNRESTTKRFQTFSQCSEKSTATPGSVMSTTHTSTAVHGQGHLTSSQTSSTIQSSMSTDHLLADTLSNRTSYCSVDGSNVNINSIGVDFKSFCSLDEAFDGEHNNNSNNDDDDVNTAYRPVKLTKSSTTSTTSWCEQPLQKHLMAVQNQTSPRKHSSLTSLTTENGVHNKTPTTKPNNTTISPSFVTQSQILKSRKHSDQDSLRSEAVSVSGTGSKSSLNESVKLSKTPTSLSGKHSPRYKSNTPKSTKVRSSPSQSSSNKNSSPPVVRKYHHSPNKWDAVMNQIASNKSVIRKNYNDVKSKVSTRITTTTGAVSGTSTGGGGASGSSASVSPTQRRSPLNNLSINRNLSPSVSKVSKISKSPESPAISSSVSSTHATTLNSSSPKRLPQNSHINRGRSYSKDSQKSSQSDLSLTSVSGGGGAGSPKLLAKTPLRAAKKRDVRNLSISPTDLGPPPKTQQTANGSSTRPKPAIISLTHHNRILNQTITTPTSNSKAIGKPETSSATTSEHQENGGSNVVVGINNNNNIHEKSTTASTRTNSRTSSPTILTNATNTTIINNKKTPASPAVTASNNTIEKKFQSKLLNSSTTSSTTSAGRKLLLQKQHQQLSEDTITNNSSLELNDELQQLKSLNRHSYNGSLNYQTFEQQQQQLHELQKQTEHQAKSTEALGVLLQYLVYDLDAFACPSLKSESLKTKEKLKKTLLLLDEAKNVCSELQDQLGDKDVYYTQRENELQALHRCELEKARSNLVEFQTMAKQQISSLETQLQNSESENKRLLEAYRIEMEHKMSQKQQQLDTAEEHGKSLSERLQALEVSEQQLRVQLTQTESSYAGRLQAAAEREHDLTERLKQLTKELDKLKALKENNERELKEKLNLSNDEVVVLRTSRRSLNESGVGSPRNTSSLTSSTHMELNRLQSEAESLRCVLELKQKEISKLTKQNEELLRDADEKLALQAKISLLESKNEMLHSELEIKSEKEKEYLRQIDEVQKAFSHETVKRTRLSYDNEALQWQLKQRSEQLHIVETKLQELSAHDISTTSVANRSSQNGASLTSSIHMDDISPPTSPVIKGVIEKTDSVSWVLEMDDETPEAAASKMVKRAGSFRSVERSPSTRRQLSVSASAAYGGNMTNCNSSLMEVAGPNPLSQSMSATSVIREHSKVEVNEFNNRSHPRIRSKSVSIKGCEGSQQQPKSSKKVSRQLSGGSSTRKNELSTNWKEPVLTSSPYVMRPRSSTLKIDNESEEVLFRRSSASKLITCDTSALNKGERLEMRSLPSHPSVQDLKVIKKCQEIQESAGEAMVSGTNSEDESCSASSDDVVSTASSSAASDSTTSSNQLKNSRMSFEEVLLIEKINSLSGTPMEVSWSEDADGLGNSSTL
ncbi:protein PF14_0175 isoform X2 [Lucilia sericata]|uniref:protein PF14_0175 isoform X2 n=1 Tax=Lucilia sericata TaxID=13632 RepID=UPI0018A866AC|nr:protein PF14_0175 isoform X2 [Lucilia sericata]